MGNARSNSTEGAAVSFDDEDYAWKSGDYSMNHKKRGMAIIFKNENFDDPEFKRLKGTKLDCDNLKKTMEGLCFEVKVHDDLTREELMKTVDEAARSDHSDCDCFVMAVLSHGDKREITARDEFYNTRSLWDPFTASRCPSLAGKPKLFFLLACRGGGRDKGFDLVIRGLCLRQIPITADFLEIYPTAPGFVSWISDTGSPFVQALCSELQDRGTSDDILTILTNVNRRVAIDFDTGPSEDPSMDKMKQMPSFTSTLTRRLIFTRK